MKTVWVAGQLFPGLRKPWNLIGVFSSEFLAKTACGDIDYTFVAPVTFNKTDYKDEPFKNCELLFNRRWVKND